MTKIYQILCCIENSNIEINKNKNWLYIFQRTFGLSTKYNKNYMIKKYLKNLKILKFTMKINYWSKIKCILIIMNIIYISCGALFFFSNKIYSGA